MRGFREAVPGIASNWVEPRAAGALLAWPGLGAGFAQSEQVHKDQVKQQASPHRVKVNKGGTAIHSPVHRAQLVPVHGGDDTWGVANDLKTAGVGDGAPMSLARWVLLYPKALTEPSPKMAITGRG